MSSPSDHSRTLSNSVPRPNAPRARPPSSSPVRAARATRSAPGRSGNTRTSLLAARSGASTPPSPSAPRTRTAAAGTPVAPAARRARPGRTELVAGVRQRRRRERDRGGRRLAQRRDRPRAVCGTVSVEVPAGAPRASTPGSSRRAGGAVPHRRSRRRAMAAASATDAQHERETGPSTSASTASTAATNAARGVGLMPAARDVMPAHARLIAGRARPPARLRSRRLARCDRARPPGRAASRWAEHSGRRAPSATSSGVTKSRPASRARARATASRCTAARGLAPSDRLGRSRVRRTTATQ